MKQNEFGQAGFPGTAFLFALAASCLIALLAPRFLAYWPGVLALAGFAAWRPVFGALPPIPWKMLAWAAGFLCLAVLSSLWADDTGYVLSRSVKAALILVPGTILAGIVLSIPEKEMKFCGKAIAWSAAAAALFCGLDMALGFPLYKLLHGLDRYADISPSVLNRSAIALLPVFFVAMGVASFGKDKALIAALALSYGLMLSLTESQSAQLGFMLAGIFYLIWPYRFRPAWQALAAILAAAVLAAPFLAIWMFDHMAFTVTSLPFLGRGAGFGAERLEIWDKISRYALSRPLHGFGMEATRFIADFDTAQIFREGVTELHPHNFAIQLWIEFGFLGAALGAGFTVFVMKLFSGLNRDQARIALPCFITILTPATFGYGLWQGWFLGFAMLTVSLALTGIRLYENKEETI